MMLRAGLGRGLGLVLIATLVLSIVLSMAGCSEQSAPSAGALTAGSSGSQEPSAPEVVEVDGEKIYNRNCFSCHAPGLAGAPKTGDVEAWAPRLAKGDELLLKGIKEGIPPGMPAMGLCNNCSDEELLAATEFMGRAQ